MIQHAVPREALSKGAPDPSSADGTHTATFIRYETASGTGRGARERFMVATGKQIFDMHDILECNDTAVMAVSGAPEGCANFYTYSCIL